MIRKKKKSKKFIVTCIAVGTIATSVYPSTVMANERGIHLVLEAPIIRPDHVIKGEENVFVTITNWEGADIKEYRINNGAWRTYNSPIEMTQNGVIYARATRLAEGVSPVASLKINNIVKEDVSGPGETMDIIYVAPNGSDIGDGTIANPMSLTKAIKEIVPGGTIYLTEGNYTYSEQFTIPYGNNGTADKLKSMIALDGAKVRLDFSSQKYDEQDTSRNARGLQLEGDYWHIKGIEFYGAADNGAYVTGNNNILELCVFNANRDTGLQIGRRNSMLIDMGDWPRENLILNCTSFNNSDPATGENADGFAAKLTCGEGNIFDGCIAYNNVDDGWDLYAKSATGPIGKVTIRNSIAFRNGATTNGEFTKNSDGNGFKLGGSSIPGSHTIENSIAFENKNHGFTDNSNPGVITVKNCTSFNNSLADGKKSNFDFARDKTNSYNIFENNISFSTQKVGSDKYKGEATNSILYNGGKWYEFTNKATADSNIAANRGTVITGPTTADFVNLKGSGSGTDIHTLWRNADGSVNIGEFLNIAGTSKFAGRNLGANLSESVRATPLISPVADDMTRYSVEGFAQGVTGGGELDESSPNYIKVTNAKELGIALKRKAPTKVIEIMNDIDLGWNMIGVEAQVAPISQHNVAKTHPTLKETGVSKIVIDGFDGLTIFSKNGAKITHGAFVIKQSNNVVIRNLEFDELWEWDEYSKGDYDKNDWDFITLEACKDVWIDHCTFGKAYDGVVDSKVGTSGLTISWCDFKSGEGSFYEAMFEELEANRSSYSMYDFLRNQGLSKEVMMQVAAPQKKTHLVGANEQKPDNNDLEITLHHNYYKDSQDRMPRLRGGKAHIYNIVMDAKDAYRAGKLISGEIATEISKKGYKFGVTSNGAISTENGEVLVENTAIYDVRYPIRNNQKDPNKPEFTGKIRALNTIYKYENISYQGDSTMPNSPLAPAPALSIETNWMPTYSYKMDAPTDLGQILKENVGAGVLSLTEAEWMKTAY